MLTAGAAVALLVPTQGTGLPAGVAVAPGMLHLSKMFQTHPDWSERSHSGYTCQRGILTALALAGFIEKLYLLPAILICAS